MKQRPFPGWCAKSVARALPPLVHHVGITHNALERSALPSSRSHARSLRREVWDEAVFDQTGARLVRAVPVPTLEAQERLSWDIQARAAAGALPPAPLGAPRRTLCVD